MPLNRRFCASKISSSEAGDTSKIQRNFEMNSPKPQKTLRSAVYARRSAKKKLADQPRHAASPTSPHRSQVRQLALWHRVLPPHLKRRPRSTTRNSKLIEPN